MILARALDTTVDELLVDDADDDVVIRPTRDEANGVTFWLLTRRDDPSGRIVAKVRTPACERLPETRVDDSFTVFRRMTTSGSTT